MAGIDSSFNSTRFQGMELWVVTAVSVRSDGSIIFSDQNQGLGKSELELSKIASRMEVGARRESVDLADIVMMDGSLYSQFMTRQAALTSSISKIMTKKNNVIFIADFTDVQFADLGAKAGDIFYYNHATKTPGFSRIFVDRKFGRGREISSIYARLSDSTPLIKIELLGDAIQKTR